MRKLRRAGERGRTDAGWLDSRHTFSFGDYSDPAWMGLRTMRVLNEERIVPRAGYKLHTHRDVEIVTYVLEGTLEQKDADGNVTLVPAGAIQQMTTGLGVEHAERNTSTDGPLRYLQLWFVPRERFLEPATRQATFPESELRGGLRLVVSSSGRDGSLAIAQDVSIYLTSLRAGDRAALVIGTGRSAWVHVVKGSLLVNEHGLLEGDGLGVVQENDITLECEAEAEALVIDMG
jgi:hypothetical protein